MSNLAETILRDVPRRPDRHGVQYVSVPDVLSALTAATDPEIAERAGEVLERLQKADEYEPLGHDGWDAADLITALLAQNAAMEAQIKGLEGGIEAACDREAETERKLRTALAASETRAEAAEAQIAALTARVEGLTGALDNIATELTGVTPEPDNMRMAIDTAASVARAALSTTEASHE